MNCKYDVVMFDFDGTVSDSATGVRETIEYTLKEMGKDIPNLDDTSLYVGPPLLTTFQVLCGLDRGEAENALEIYRTQYNKEGKYKNYAYNGIKKLVKDIQESGAKAIITTSKYERFACECLEIIGLKGVFDKVYGATIDSTRKEKAEIISYALKDIKGSAKNSVLIGDSAFDTRGAVKAGCDFIGVTYGFGKKSQMVEAGGINFADTVDDIYKFLFKEE